MKRKQFTLKGGKMTKREKCEVGNKCTSKSCNGCTYGVIEPEIDAYQDRCEDAPCCGCCN